MRIEFELDHAAAHDAFNRLLKSGSGMSDLMLDIGEDLLHATRERFNDEQDAAGRPWRPLSAVTLARKKTNRDKVLTEKGHLRDAINYRAGRSHVDIGSSRIHAATPHGVIAPEADWPVRTDRSEGVPCCPNRPCWRGVPDSP